MYKNYKYMGLVLTILLMFSLTGCAISDSNAKLVPSSELNKKETFYVVLSKTDKRDIANTIAEVLTTKGYLATSGNLNNIPSNVDVIVTYEDRWMWDITNYLIKLNMQFRNADNMYPYLAGETIRTSLIRKDVKGMVEETINTMLNKSREVK